MRYLKKINESKNSIYEDCKDVFAELLDFNSIRLFEGEKYPYIGLTLPKKIDDFTKLVDEHKKFTETLEDIGVGVKRLSDIYDDINVATDYAGNNTLYLHIGVGLNKENLIRMINKLIVECDEEYSDDRNFIDLEDLDSDPISISDDKDILKIGIAGAFIGIYDDDGDKCDSIFTGYDKFEITILLEIIGILSDYLKK